MCLRTSWHELLDRMTTGLLTDYFSCGHAASSNWRAAAEAALAQCGTGVRGATLGFAYATDAFADDYSDILEFARAGANIWTSLRSRYCAAASGKIASAFSPG